MKRSRKAYKPRPEAWTGDPLSHAKDCQAKRILLRFGGVRPFLEALLTAGIRRTAQSVYHWVREGGLIPPNGVRDVMLAEPIAGIRLTDADWSPYEADAATRPPEGPQDAPEEFQAAGDDARAQGEATKRRLVL